MYQDKFSDYLIYEEIIINIFSDEVNKYLDMYYSKIVKTILYFGLNNKLEFLVGRDDTIIV